MDKKLLEIYDKCMEHNISISMTYLLSDASIEVVGKTLAFRAKDNKYEILKCSKWVRIQEMRDSMSECVATTIESVFDEILTEKKKIENR